jgi:hypothetical protein
MRVGDYVIPDDLETPDAAWTPCKVTHLYENGDLRARSDKGDVTWTGPVKGFKQVEQ